MLKIWLFVPLFLAAALLHATEPLILITYHSETGNTRQMARAVQQGALEVEGVRVVMKSVEDATTDDLLAAHAIIVGSPVYNANVSPQVSAFISSWPFEGAPLRGKLGAAFVTAGGVSAGEELTQMNILQSMLIFGMVVMGGQDWTAPFGASAIRGEALFPDDQEIHPAFLEKGRKLGQNVAHTAKRLNQDETKY